MTKPKEEFSEIKSELHKVLRKWYKGYEDEAPNEYLESKIVSLFESKLSLVKKEAGAKGYRKGYTEGVNDINKWIKWLNEAQVKEAKEEGKKEGLLLFSKRAEKNFGWKPNEKWHKSEQNGLERPIPKDLDVGVFRGKTEIKPLKGRGWHEVSGMCTNFNCALEMQHEKSCPLYGQPYVK